MSILRDFYYEVKPYIPFPVRMGLRRRLARRKLRRSDNLWPINPAASEKPANWPGWPEGKRFALVLTHDVESEAGVANCRQLMELERSLGFRSLFNFVPEGTYHTPSALRAELAENGFEVGVHDLHHDGKLFRSREDFFKAAPKINQYLREWGAVGFRAGFMRSNLDWLHALEIRYDMSTFDTDPFEPQPDGVHTVFPFWVQNGVSGKGYLEMPYTLPQDSTVFLLLEQKNNAIWKEKLKWIQEREGMALINVHPDYISFDQKSRPSTYPAEHYSDFLRHIREQYEGQYWNALPVEVAERCAVSCPGRASRLPKRVAMVSYSAYESDNRVMRYADALAGRGDEVDVYAITLGQEKRRSEVINGVKVFRLQNRVKNERGQITYLVRLLRFLASSSCVLAWKHIKNRYDVVHVHNVPDFLVFAAWLPRLTGARVILDIHDIVPEFYASKFKAGGPGFLIEALKRIEKWSCAFAHHVIISNHLWLKTIIERSAAASKTTAVINYIDNQVFYRRERTRQDEKFVAIFPGGLQWHQGLDIAVRAFQIVARQIPHAELHIYGEGDMKSSLLALAEELGLSKVVHIFPPVRLREVAGIIRNADIGIVPKRADSFGNEAFSTKIMEFMSQGIPVVASETKIDRFYFNDRIVRFFPSGDHEALAKAVIEIYRSPAAAAERTEHATEFLEQNNWKTNAREYFAIVDDTPGSWNDSPKEPASALVPA